MLKHQVAADGALSIKTVNSSSQSNDTGIQTCCRRGGLSSGLPSNQNTLMPLKYLVPCAFTNIFKKTVLTLYIYTLSAFIQCKTNTLNPSETSEQAAGEHRVSRQIISAIRVPIFIKHTRNCQRSGTSGHNQNTRFSGKEQETETLDITGHLKWTHWLFPLSSRLI